MSGVLRQGDVVLIPCEIPKGAHTINRAKRWGKGEGIILAAGEQTGHHHRVREKNVRIRTKDGVSYLSVGKGGASLKHEEHDDIKLPAGTQFRIGTQREYNPPKPKETRRPARQSFRRVSD